MRLRFSIRDLLWLTLVAALLVAGWLDHRQMASEISSLKREMDIERAEFTNYADQQKIRVESTLKAIKKQFEEFDVKNK